MAIEHLEGFHRPGSRAQKNNNPGNLRWGRFARRWGAKQRDDQHLAVFPTEQAGHNALRTFLQTKYGGRSLRYLGAHYSPKPNWAETIAKIAGISLDAVI